MTSTSSFLDTEELHSRLIDSSALIEVAKAASGLFPQLQLPLQVPDLDLQLSHLPAELSVRLQPAPGWANRLGPAQWKQTEGCDALLPDLQPGRVSAAANRANCPRIRTSSPPGQRFGTSPWLCAPHANPDPLIVGLSGHRWAGGHK